MSLNKKMLLIGVLSMSAMLLSTGTAAYAVRNTLPAGTAVTVSGTLHFDEGINGLTIKVKCTSFAATATVVGPNHLNFVPSPAITGCTDSLGGTDTITTNSTNGNWFLAAPAPMKLGIPQAGATFTSTAVQLAGCTTTWTPAGLVKLTGAYNGVNTEKVTSQPLAVSAVGCSASTMKIWVKAVMAPNTGPVPPW